VNTWSAALRPLTRTGHAQGGGRERPGQRLPRGQLTPSSSESDLLLSMAEQWQFSLSAPRDLMEVYSVAQVSPQLNLSSM
jgi:hypothetical protein